MTLETDKGSEIVAACGACRGTRMSRIAHLSLYVRNGTVDDTIWKCEDCGTYMRTVDFDDPLIRTHFDVASYTNPDAEPRIRRVRIGFFAHLLTRARGCLDNGSAKPRVLDVGATYGHMADLCREQGIPCAVVEIVDDLREQLRKRGFDAYASVDDIPTDRVFDIITMIDSLYYCQQPAAVLKRLHPLLAPDGVLVIRISNRTPIINLLQTLHRPPTNTAFGDAKYNFSDQGIRSLLADCGFEIEKVVLNEKGKRPATWTRWLYYKTTLLASLVFRVKLTPGIILLCRRKRWAQNDHTRSGTATRRTHEG